MGVSSSRNLKEDKPLVSVTKSFLDNDNTQIPLKKQVDKIKIPVQIETLYGCDPVYFEFTKNTSIRRLQKTVNTTLGVEPNTLQVIGCAKIPQSLPLIIGDENRYDFGNKIFIIDTKTTFIEYFNDLLHAANDYVSMIENENMDTCIIKNKSKSNNIKIIKERGNLKTCLQSNKLKIGNDISIQFNKTLRKINTNTNINTNNNKQVGLCPQLGIFKVFKVNNYIHKVPKKWIHRNGLIIPLWQKEALYLSIKCCNYKQSKYAIKIKINTINGNCAILPRLSRLDGVNYKQFVAMPLGYEYQCDDEKGVMQIEIYEKFNDNAHISIDKQVLYSCKEYDKKLLDLTPKQAGFKRQDKVYLFSHEMPAKLWRECTVMDAMYADKENIIYMHCNEKNVIGKWMNLFFDELEFKNEYLIEAIGYKKDEKIALKYNINTFENGLDVKINLNRHKYDNIYFKDNLLNENKSLMEQGVNCGDMIFKMLISNQIIIFIKILNEKDMLRLNVCLYFTISQIKGMIMDECDILFDEYVLMDNNNDIMDNDKKRLSDYNVKNEDILQCILKVNAYDMEGDKKEEINLMDISYNNVCFSRYNHRTVTSVFVHIVNGVMWKKITGKELPKTNIDLVTYQQYGYLWSGLFEEKATQCKNDNKKHRETQPKMPPINGNKKDLFEPNDNYLEF